MPKRPLAALVVTCALASAACGRLHTQDVRPLPPDDVLFLRTSRGITVVSALSESPAVQLPDAVPSADWSAVVQSVRSAGWTEVIAHDPASGAELWSRDVRGNLDVKLASANGRFVALGERGDRPGYADGRASTTLVVVDRDAPEPRTIVLRGNYEPEAFSSDGRSLFVVEYVPPMDPTSYRVRRLDLRTEEVVGVYTVDAELQEAMQGTARVQISSPDGKRLYTLYTVEGPDGTERAFVHVLSLDELWAHCVDLPAGFGTASEQAIALAVSHDGSRLYVADSAADVVAEVDTEELVVTRSDRVVFGRRGAPSHALIGSDGTLYLGGGESLVAVDLSTMNPTRSWDVARRITGLQAGIDGTRLYVGLRDDIAILDTRNGDRLGVLSPDQIGTIDQLGESTRTFEEDERGNLPCAC